MLCPPLIFLRTVAIGLTLCVISTHSVFPAEPDEPLVDTKLPRYSKAANPVKGRLRIGGGGTTERFLRPLVVEFNKLYPDVSYDIALRGSATAPTGLGNREYNLGVMSRAMTAEEEADVKKNSGTDVVEVTLAADAILILVNENNPVKGVTLAQLDALYGTKRLAGYKKPIATWADLGVTGELANAKVSPYGILEENNGTVETFRRRAARRSVKSVRGSHQPAPQGIWPGRCKGPCRDFI